MADVVRVLANVIEKAGAGGPNTRPARRRGMPPHWAAAERNGRWSNPYRLWDADRVYSRRNAGVCEALPKGKKSGKVL